jgi:hypothetical protein
VPVIPFSLEMFALRRLTTAAFGTLMCLEPAIALLAGLALLHQVPRLWSLTGIALVVIAGLGAERTGARSGTPPGLADGFEVGSDGSQATEDLLGLVPVVLARDAGGGDA